MAFISLDRYCIEGRLCQSNHFSKIIVACFICRQNRRIKMEKVGNNADVSIRGGSPINGFCSLFNSLELTAVEVFNAMISDLVVYNNEQSHAFAVI